MQKNRHHWILSDVNIIRCRSKDTIEFCLMLISSDAVKRDIMEFSLMLISSDVANRRHWILSDVNDVRCRKAAIIECHVMLTSSDAEKSCHEILTALTDTGQQLSMNILWCLYYQMQERDVIWILSDVNIVRYIKTAITEFSLMLISSEAEKQIPLKLIWC